MKQEEYSDDIEIEDSEGYRSKSDTISFRTIVLKQLQTVMAECSKEITYAGTKQRVIDGIMIEVSVPDQTDIIINSIKALKLLLGPQIEQNKDDKEIKKFFDDFDKGFIDLEAWKNNQINEYQQKAKPNISQVQMFIQTRSDKESQVKKKEEYTQFMNNLHKEYDNTLLRLYQEKVFSGICFLLNKLNFMEEVSSTVDMQP